MILDMNCSSVEMLRWVVQNIKLVMSFAIFQVGTTTWLTHFLRLSALSEDAKNDTMYSSPKLHRNIPPMFRVPNDYDLDLR